MSIKETNQRIQITIPKALAEEIKKTAAANETTVSKVAASVLISHYSNMFFFALAKKDNN